jgi:hypothetical protein
MTSQARVGNIAFDGVVVSLAIQRARLERAMGVMLDYDKG